MLKKTLLFILMIGLILVGASYNIEAVEYDTPEAREAAAQYDFEGETVRIGMRNTGSTPFAATGELDYLEPEGELLGHIEWLEEHFNVNLEFTNTYLYGDYEEELMEIIAGDIDADILMVGRDAFYGPAAEGALLPLDAYLEEEYFENYAPDPRELNKLLGEKYRIGGGTHYQLHLLAYNKPMFEEYGWPSPYELWQDGEWDWDAFEEIALDATRDTTGDGEIDQFGFTSFLYGWGQYEGFAMTNDAAMTREIDGEIKFTFNEPEALEALEFLNSLHEEEAMTIAEFWGDAIDEGDVAMWIAPLTLLDHFFDPAPEFRLVPYPRGPEADEKVAWAGGAHGFGIPISTDTHRLDPRALVELVHALHLDGRRGNTHDPGFDNPNSPYTDDPRGSWRETISQHVHDAESVEAIEWGQERAQIVEGFDLIEPLIEEWGELIEDIITGEEDPASGMEAIAPRVQSVIDEMFDQ